MMKKLGPIILMVMLANAIIIFVVCYASGNNLVWPRYNMSEKYVKFSNLQVENTDELDFLLENENIRVVAETDDVQVIGIYDMPLYYYNLSTKYIFASKFRYFSKQDYIEKNNVAVCIDDILNVSPDFIYNMNLSYIEEKYNVKIINMFGFESAIAESGIKIVQNLFSIPKNKITYIYIDAKDKKDIIWAKNKMLEHGYKEEKVKLAKSLKSILMETFKSSQYVRYFIYSGLITYIVMLYIYWVFLSQYKKFIEVSGNVGGRYKDILFKLIKGNLVAIILAMLISCFMSTSYLQKINKYYLEFKDLLCLELFIFLSLGVLLFTKYSNIYLRFMENRKDKHAIGYFCFRSKRCNKI